MICRSLVYFSLLLLLTPRLFAVDIFTSGFAPSTAYDPDCGSDCRDLSVFYCSEENVVLLTGDDSFYLDVTRFEVSTNTLLKRKINCVFSTDVYIPEGFRIRLRDIDMFGEYNLSERGEANIKASFQIATERMRYDYTQFARPEQGRDFFVISPRVNSRFYGCDGTRLVRLEASLLFSVERDAADLEDTSIGLRPEDQGVMSFNFATEPCF